MSDETKRILYTIINPSLSGLLLFSFTQLSPGQPIHISKRTGNSGLIVTGPPVYYRRGAPIIHPKSQAPNTTHTPTS